jgi:hypothetical protein
MISLLKRRCQATANRGHGPRPCAQWALNDSDYCWYHEPGAGRKFGSGYTPTRATALEPWRDGDPETERIRAALADHATPKEQP